MDMAWVAMKAIVAVRKTPPPIRIPVGAFSKPIAFDTGIRSLLGLRGKGRNVTCGPNAFEAFEAGRPSNGTQAPALTIAVAIIYDARSVHNLF
jgi:hypothetical protein